MKAKKQRVLSLALATVLASSVVTGNNSVAWAADAAEPTVESTAQDTSTETGTLITDEEMEELLSGSVIERTRASVHDPSIVSDGKGNYYVFGSHMAAAVTTNLSDWDSLFGEKTDSKLFADASGNCVSYNDAFKENAYTQTVNVTLSDGTVAAVDFGSYDISAWIADNSVSGNMWAPDVIYNTTMNKWCMYLSLNGANWDCSIVLLTADEIGGPYVYQGPVVFSGFSTADSSDSYKDTDLELVYGELDSLPKKYNQRTDTSNGSWGDYWPNAIDPCVFYDDDGNLWMSYGSWSGGIYMLELDETNGLRDYTVTYDSSDVADKSCTSDAYFGTKIAGGCYVSGEGSYIQKIGEYYYLFISYGFYSPEGGYNMRVFRSKSPDGEYVDCNGTSAIYTEWVQNYNGSDNRGERLMAAYKWDTMDEAEIAQGHNSVLVDEDGNIFVVYHTKFADGTASHELRVHQLFVNEDGWLVAAPYEYSGETLSEEGYTTEDVAGEYDTILHSYVQDYANLEYATPEQITLSADGSVSGTYNGTWLVENGTNNITIDLGEEGVFKGVLVEQQVDNESYSTLCFTAVNEDGLCIWGSKSMDDRTVIALNVKNIDFGVPEYAYTDFTPATEGFSGATITWTSSNPDVLAADGTVSAVTEDTTVTLTARIARGEYYYDKKFTVVVRPGDGTFSEKTLIASYFTDDPQDLSTTMDGSLSVRNPFADSVSKGIDISGGVDIEFDVTSTGDLHALGTILAFMGSGRLYFTPSSYLGYNATGGYFDANVKDYGLVTDYIGESAHVSLQFTKTGFSVYVNGELAYDESILATEAGAGTVTDYKKVLTWLNQSADTLYFGYGSWWATAGYDEANCTISNVNCYVEATPVENAWYTKDSVTITSDTITYEANPFYGVETESIYLAYTINFAEAPDCWKSVFSFYNSKTTGRISIQANPYVCYNDSNGSWIDLNSPENWQSGGYNWAVSAESGKDYRVEIYIDKSGATITIDGNEIACSVKGADGVTYEDLLSFIGTCDKLTWGCSDKENGNVSTFWGTGNYTLTDIVFADNLIPVTMTQEDTTITSADYIDRQENPLQGKEIEELEIDYTINFSEGTAKNGWDGIFSFYNSTTGGRVSMQTAPYLCYNSLTGEWIDYNSPSYTALGGRDWALTAETGRDYQVCVKITETEVAITIDGEDIPLSINSASGVTAADMLSFIGTCDQFTMGVGPGKTAYWNTELCKISDFSMLAKCKTEEQEKIEVISDNSWKFNSSDAILYQDNPVAGHNLETLEISYDIEFDSLAAKNGWDGLFSFYDKDTNARVSFSSAPYICFNNAKVGTDDYNWADINSPLLSGAEDWAANKAEKDTTYHVEISICSDEITMSVDGTPITIAENSGGLYSGYQDILDQIAACPQLTIGVGQEVSAYWNTELCTLSNLKITATDKKEEVENPGEGETQTPGEGETQTPSEGETQTPGEGETQTPSEGETQKPSQEETQKPSQEETQKPSQEVTQKPSQSETQTPSQEETQNPSQNQTTDQNGVVATDKTESTVKGSTTIKTITKKLAAGKKVLLKTDLPKSVSGKKLTWSTSNKNYATVSKKGVVTTKKAGIGKTVKITATTASGKETVIKVKIAKGEVSKVTAKAESETVKAGKSVAIKTTVKATAGANKKLTFTSSNTKYATVSADGVVKTTKAGKGKTVKITVSSTDGSAKKATVTIKIK